jgi:hypothetical protein
MRRRIHACHEGFKEWVHGWMGGFKEWVGEREDKGGYREGYVTVCDRL